MLQDGQLADKPGLVLLLDLLHLLGHLVESVLMVSSLVRQISYDSVLFRYPSLQCKHLFLAEAWEVVENRVP